MIRGQTLPIFEPFFLRAINHVCMHISSRNFLKVFLNCNGRFPDELTKQCLAILRLPSDYLSEQLVHNTGSEKQDQDTSWNTKYNCASQLQHFPVGILINKAGFGTNCPTHLQVCQQFK